MKHHVKQRSFGRPKNQREALLASLARALVEKEKIQTTEAKAKEVRPIVEKLVTRAMGGNLHTRRILISRLGSEKLVGKLIADIAPRYKERAGGYTRITKLNPRKSDSAKMAVIEFI